MNLEPQAAPYRPDPTIMQVAEGLADPVAAADFPETILRYRNDRWAATVGLADLDDEAWLRHFGRFEPLPNNLPQPLALRYHGHQFRVYNPEIGDGRGFLFAQMRDGGGRLMDLGTKGSGTTPYSRTGDGRLTLKGGVREILATEMLEALGVETSKTFSLVETGEELWRNDEPSPTRSAVMVRLSHGHIRFGTFQRMAAEREEERMRALVGYCLDEYFDGAGDRPEEAPARLLHHAVERMARLAASYMVAGFVHGVLNTDNMNITGESFDYGPWRFAPKWQPDFTAAYFDHGKLYCFARQPEAMHWNCGQLGSALSLISPTEPLIEALERFGPLYQHELVRHFCWRLGVIPRGMDRDRELVQAAEQIMLHEDVSIDRFFHDWTGVRLAGAFEGKRANHMADLLLNYRHSRTRKHRYWLNPNPCAMLIDEVEAIWSAIDERDDWTPLHRKVAAVRELGEALRDPPPEPW